MVACAEAWFRWAGIIAALLGVRVEAPRDMGFLRGRHDEKNGYLLEIWREVRPKQWKWRTYRRRDVCASPVFFLHDAHFVDAATITDLRLCGPFLQQSDRALRVSRRVKAFRNR